MRCITLLLFLGATAAYCPAAAQVAEAPVAAPSLLTARYSLEDTLRAVRNLFIRRTRGAINYTAAGATILAGAAAKTVAQRAVARGRRRSEVQRIDTNQDWLAGGLMLGYGVFRLSRYGADQYATIVTAYQQGEPLPTYVRRQLRPKYFRYRPF